MNSSGLSNTGASVIMNSTLNSMAFNTNQTYTKMALGHKRSRTINTGTARGSNANIMPTSSTINGEVSVHPPSTKRKTDDSINGFKVKYI